MVNIPLFILFIGFQPSFWWCRISQRSTAVLAGPQYPGVHATDLEEDAEFEVPIYGKEKNTIG
jgi:hypothetical protein